MLDEPTVGLDPAQIREIRALIRDLGDLHSVILSTHLLSEVESVCDRVEIMQRGKLIYSDTSAHMKQHEGVSGFIVGLRKPPQLNVLEGISGISNVEQLSSTKFRILHTPDHNPRGALLTLAEQQGWELEQLTPLHATLEDVYVKITDAETAAAPARSTPKAGNPLSSKPDAELTPPDTRPSGGLGAAPQPGSDPSAGENP